MKRIPMILLLAAPYVLLFVILFTTDSAAFFTLILFSVILLFNMVYAFLLPRLGFRGEQILFWNMLLKLCNIPIYVFIFAAALFMNIFIIPALPFLILFDYFLLLPSTMYGISGMRQCCKSGTLSAVKFVINSIVQFFFCLDVFSGIYCYITVRRAGKGKKEV